MPTYEYSCDRCGQTLEVFQSFSARPLKIHEGCGGKLTKVLHARGIVFKGSGFYATDGRGKTTSTPSTNQTPAASSTKKEKTSTPKATIADSTSE